MAAVARDLEDVERGSGVSPEALLPGLRALREALDAARERD